MSYTVQKLKSDLEGIGHGLTLNQITNVNGLIDRAARQILLDIDPQETKRLVPLGAQLFQAVYDYPLPDDVKGNKIIDIRPQVHRRIRDEFTQTYSEAFDVFKNKNTYPQFTIDFNTAVKTIRIADTFVVPIGVNAADQINDNGTWSVGGDAQNLQQDSINFVAGNSSLRFDLSGLTGSAYLENSTMGAVNLSRDVNQGVEFCWNYFPDPSIINSVKLRWGSSSTDYWENTVTEQWTQNAFITGWNQIGFEWDGATMVGSPNYESITYLRIIFDYDYDGTPIYNMRINEFTSSLGSIYNIEYYSKYMFRNSVTGAFQETVSSNSDLINLDTESYNLLTYQCAILMIQQQQGGDGASDMKFFQDMYAQGIARYKAMYKSEIIKPKLAYYTRTSNSFRKWFGTGPRGGTPF